MKMIVKMKSVVVLELAVPNNNAPTPPPSHTFYSILVCIQMIVCIKKEPCLCFNPPGTTFRLIFAAHCFLVWCPLFYLFPMSTRLAHIVQRSTTLSITRQRLQPNLYFASLRRLHSSCQLKSKHETSSMVGYRDSDRFHGNYPQRTIKCGQLTTSNEGERVVLSGWVQSPRYMFNKG